ncbi:class I SAM-dependent methyltransferase [Falsiroseomonas sp. HW251]|uniref:class I SAM-dependent methyltransferase n=1 Tax=Falsiroseomonas sp. HW251 TaxID=3390998 RepID=UPI003D31C557
MSFRDAEYAGWTARAASYDAHFAAITSQAIPAILEAVGDLAGRRFLDVCCGPGHLAAAAAERGALAEGIDFAPTMVAQARRNHPAVTFREGNAEHLDHPAASFDAVACAFGVLHLPSPDQAIAEAFRVLRPGGIFTFTQWAAEDELLALVGSAVARHGDPGVTLPPAPPPMRFALADECCRTLVAAGFTEVAVVRLGLAWHTERPEAVLELIHGGALRAAMLIESQPPSNRERIEAAIVEAVRSRPAPGGGFRVQRPTLLAKGRKPPARCPDQPPNASP